MGYLPHSATPEERLLARCKRSPSGCLEWQGAKIKYGYGHLRPGGKRGDPQPPILTHRLAWELWRGPIPEGLCVLHRCDNPPCVEVDHLFLGTKADNNRDRDEKGRTVSPNGPRPDGNYAIGERHPNARLTAEQAKAAYADPRPVAEIAKAYGVTPACVYHVKSGRSWSHVTRVQK